MISIDVLGDPLLSGPAGPITGRATYRRRLALLSILATARGRPVGRERLMALLWPELSTGSARHALSEALYVLRRELGEDVFLLVGSEVGLNAARVRSDVDEFERALQEGRAAEAARLYRGPFLDGFHVADAAEFERWADGERDRLARLYARAVQGLAETAEAAGDPLEAAEWWRRLAAHDPYSSRVALRLAGALRAAGEGAGALRHLEAHAAFLHEELGVGPDPELLSFVERLRAEAAPLPPRPAAAPPAPPAAPASFPSPASSTASAESGETADSGPATSPALHFPPPPEPAPAPPPAVAASAPPETAVLPASMGRRAGRRTPALAYAAAGALMAVFAVALLALGRPGGGAPAASAPAGHDPRRVAVLYFDDNSPGGELGYLARGLTEMLIHELGQVRALDVVSRNGVKPYREGTVPLDSVAARLRVGSVVEGSVQRSGARVQVAVRLVDANTQSQLESRVIVRPLDDVLALERALAEEVSRSLRRRLGREVRLRQAGAETKSAAALELVLQAEEVRADAEAVARHRDPADAASARRGLARADSLLARAEMADPRWTRPTLLRGWVAYATAELVPGPERLPHLRAAEARAGRVLKRRRGSAEALELRGTARWALALRQADSAAAEASLDAAEHDLRAAVATDAALAGAWGRLSRLLLNRGRFAEAHVTARRALEADAFLADADILLQRLFFGALMVGDHRLAADACARGAGMFPGDWRFVECGLTLLREDPARPPDPALAWRLVAELERLDPPARARGEGRAYAPLYRRMVAAAVAARAGEAARARAEVARARAEAAGDPDARVSLAYDEAYVRVLLGEPGEARARLDEYLAARPALRPFVQRVPLFRGLVSAGTGAGTPAGSAPAPVPAGSARRTAHR